MNSFERLTARTWWVKTTLIWLLSTICLLSTAVYATNFYVDNSKTKNGTGTKSSPWNSLTSVNTYRLNYSPAGFRAGDNIYLKRNTPKSYTLSKSKYVNRGVTGNGVPAVLGVLSPRGNGALGAPITIDAYDTGSTPVIEVGDTTSVAGILLYNQNYWTINNLEIKNTSTTQAYRWGILVYFSRQTSDVLRSGIHITNNYVHDIYATYYGTGIPSKFYSGGIYVWVAASPIPSYSSSTPANNHIDDVIIQGNTIKNITGIGIVFRGESIYDDIPDVMNWNNLSTNVIIRNNSITNTIDGIMWLGTKDALIEYNVVDSAAGTAVKDPLTAVRDTVKYPDASNDPFPRDPTKYTGSVVAIWPACTEGGLVQYNEVKNTKLKTGDGQAFDSDNILKDTLVFQYNYSHNNEGGFLLSCEASATMQDEVGSQTIARYNISQNDGLPSGSTWPDPNNKGKLIHYDKNNTIVYNNVFYLDAGGIFQILNNTGKTRSITFRNNIFYGPEMNWSCGPNNTDINVIENNCFWGGCESFLPANTINSFKINPQFVNHGSGGQGLNSVQGYNLKYSSPLLSAGRAISSNGGQDFWGSRLNGLTAIGAYTLPDIIPIYRLLKLLN